MHPIVVVGRTLVWGGAVVLTTGVLWAFRAELDKAHMALAFLLVVLGGSARHGRRLGLVLAVISFLCFNFFLLPPYYTFVIHDPLDWGVLLTFLITGAVAAQLLYRAQREAGIALQRAEEIDRLSVLGAETLNVGRAEEAVEAIARVIHSTLRIVSCEVHLRDTERDTFRHVAGVHSRRWDGAQQGDESYRKVAGEGVTLVDPARADGREVASLGEALRNHTSAREVLVPLKVRGAAVGILRLADDAPLRFDAAQVRFTEVLAYYAALGLERVLLAEEAERVGPLREADRLKEALMASVSHDLRTPLTTIKALAHELRATGDERAVAIEEEADRLNTLVANLLDLSRLNAGVLPLSLEIIAAEDLIGSALQRVSGAQQEREIRVSLEEDTEIALGRFDFSHALRVLVNLLENALKYSSGAMPVEVRVRRAEEDLILSVLDRGPGIPLSESERIFEPFYRPSGAETDAPGTGLGLAIARRLAEAQGGAVRYEPRTGGGSVFHLVLPAVRSEEILS